MSLECARVCPLTLLALYIFGARYAIFGTSYAEDFS